MQSLGFRGRGGCNCLDATALLKPLTIRLLPPSFFFAAVASMTLRYAEGFFACKECGSTRLEFDEALRGGLLQGSSVPSGSLLPVLVSPAWDHERVSFHGKGGGVPRRTNSFASRVARSTIAGIPWGSAASTRFAGSGSGFFVRGFGFWLSVRRCRCCFFCFPFGDQERVFFF